MYLVVVAIPTSSGHVPVRAEDVRTALYQAASGTHLLEHDYLDVRGDEVRVSLYLHTADQTDAELLAVQLCHATTRALGLPGDPRVRSVREGG
jgi:hypothetical protein